MCFVRPPLIEFSAIAISPASAASSVKLLVAIAVKNDGELRQLDVKQARIRSHGAGSKDGVVHKGRVGFLAARTCQ